MDIHFIDPVPEVLEEVRRLTGKEIRFIEKDDLATYASLKMARRHMPCHLVYYRKKHDEIINHLIVHECGHLFRIFRCPQNRRLMPYSDREIKLNAVGRMGSEIAALGTVLSRDQITHVIDIWYNGLIRQLTNLPPDIMIEKWIYDKYPALRELQLKSLEKQHAEAMEGISEENMSGRVTPETILSAYNVMNYAFFRILGFHIGRNFVKPYGKTRYLEKGKALASITEKECDDSHEGDNLMIDRWAAFLNLSGWFQWRGFEDVPANYGQEE